LDAAAHVPHIAGSLWCLIPHFLRLKFVASSQSICPPSLLISDEAGARVCAEHTARLDRDCVRCRRCVRARLQTHLCSLHRSAYHVVARLCLWTGIIVPCLCSLAISRIKTSVLAGVDGLHGRRLHVLCGALHLLSAYVWTDLLQPVLLWV
jgi:hypothetical protein